MNYYLIEYSLKKSLLLCAGLARIMQGIIIDTCKELEITVPACVGRLTLNLNYTSENFIFLAIYRFELTVNALSAKWLYS